MKISKSFYLLLLAIPFSYAYEVEMPENPEAYSLKTAIINGLFNPEVKNYSIKKEDSVTTYTVYLKGTQDIKNVHTGLPEKVTKCSRLIFKHTVNDNTFVDFDTQDCVR